MQQNAQTQTSVIAAMQDSVEHYLSEQVKYLQQRILIYQDLINGSGNAGLQALSEKNALQKPAPLRLSETLSQ